ncbi:3-oxoacyl-[acyl-carrier-protein] reductase [Nocardioides hungaricus]
MSADRMPVAVVTGAGTGIGRACVERLLGDGYRVAMLGRREQVLLDAAVELDPARDRTTTATCDVSDPVSVDEVLGRVAAEQDGLDLLVNNAGLLTPVTIARTTDEDWSSMVQANLGGTFHGLRVATRLMRESGRGGAVVNVASMLGALAVAGFGAYGATKAGIIQLTKVAALESARYGIRVNAVLPGYVATPMSDAAQADEQMMESIVARIPLGRFAGPEEIADAVAYVAGAQYVTGSTLLIDGGYSLRP